MLTVIFYEKSGCAGNARQKKLLKAHGIELEVRSLLDETWSLKKLAPFFEALSNKEMVNAFAPKIKKGELDIEALSKEALMELMIHEPILIKRPLLTIGDHNICGFDIKQLNALLQINMQTDKQINSCKSTDPCKTQSNFRVSL